MGIIQSNKLREEQEDKRSTQFELAGMPGAAKVVPVTEIKRVTSYNDYVVVLRHRVVSEIEIGDAAKRPEGIVVGIPEGPWGENMPKLGDKVKFYERSISEEIKVESGYYAGRELVVIKVTGILFRIPNDRPTIIE